MKNLLAASYNRYKYYILVSVVCYSLSMIVGVIVGLNVSVSTSSMNLSYGDIFFNNIQVGLLIIGTGIITLGIGGIIIISYNAFSLGYIISSVANTYGIFPIITAVLPHFVPEMIAAILCCSVGFETSMLIGNMFSKDSNIEWRKLFRAVSFLLLLIILLFGFAALIETYISYN